MFSIAFKTLRANLPRFISTLVAIAVGVAFLVAGNMLTLSIRNSLGGEIDRQYSEVSAAVTLRNDELAQSGAISQGVPEDVVDTVASLPHVVAAAGDGSGLTRFAEDRLSDNVSFGASGLTVRAWYDNDLNVATLDEGRAPQADREVTLDRKTMKDRELELGDTVELTSLDGAVEVTIVGVTSFGSTASADQGGTAMTTPEWSFALGANAANVYRQVLVQSDGTVSDGELAESIRDTLPDTLTAVTGDTFRRDLRENFEEILNILAPVLTGFAFLALFVCGFVIFNTFSVVVQQRTRELALMRAVAATPRQVRRSLRLEGFGIGLLGSVIGIGLGSLLSFLLGKVLETLDLGLPPASMAITPMIVLMALAAGVIVTMISVLVPAWRAGRTAPVAAMREAAIERNRLGRVRLGFAVAFLAIGVGLCFAPNGIVIGVGAFVFVLGVFLAGPSLAVLVSRATRPVLSLFGMAGRLSSDNVARNPKRTATTMNALIIGVLLVTLVSIAGNSLKSTVVDYIADQSTTDLYVASIPGSIDEQMLADIDAVDGVTASVRVRQIPVLVDGTMTMISTTDDLNSLSAVDIEPMDFDWDELGDGAVALLTDPSMGTLGTRTVVNSLGTTYEMDYTGYLENTFDAGSLGFVVSSAEFDKIAPPDTGVNFLLMTFEPTKKVAATRAIEDLTQGFGNILVIEGNFIGRIIESVFNFLINAVNGLLGMSVVIALIGIVNTLTLSVFERRRELGLLRAVGMTRREVRRMVRFEAVQMSLLGTLIGLGSGSLLAWLLLRATELQEVTFGWKNLAVIFLLELLLGILASIAPTRRVSKLDILASIKTE